MPSRGDVNRREKMYEDNAWISAGTPATAQNKEQPDRADEVPSATDFQTGTLKVSCRDMAGLQVN